MDVEEICLDECDRARLTVWVSVGNAGRADVVADFALTLVGVLDDGTEQELATTVVTDPVPAGTQLGAVKLVVDPVPPTLASVRATVDAGNDASEGAVPECIEGNNEAPYDENLCPQ